PELRGCLCANFIFQITTTVFFLSFFSESRHIPHFHFIEKKRKYQLFDTVTGEKWKEIDA
ncbi:hypothetical protein Q6247_26670, partial [Klebsiella pneumoniae]